ncbi:MAG: hypothetical protein M1824_003728 [Vezdaea acicularis]|nr:MAG: hypothetical protein M1824_003728 [Vezdaea acicularis]
MRRHHRGGGGPTAHATRANGTPVPDTLSLIRTFDSETNPSKPIRPSPLTASPIQGMPLDLLDRIRSFPLFLSAPDSFLVAIGSQLRPQLHLPHDYIITEGDEAKAMYWLVRGSVAVTSRDGESTYVELKPGAFFGEIGILMGIPRTATIVARSRVLLFVLKKEDLQKELPKFPEVERTIREEAQERLTILNKKKKESGYAKTVGTSQLPTRGGKRSRETNGDVAMPENIPEGEVSAFKKRKSPSPRLTESQPSSSALANGMVNVRQTLRELPLFSSLPANILHFLGLSAQPRSYPPFTNIITQGSQGREVFFIIRGEVEVVDERPGSYDKSGKGRTNGISTPPTSRIKARLKPGQYFGEVASLSLAPRRTATVRSVQSVECLMITGEVLNEFWRRCPPSIREQVEQTAKTRLEPSIQDVDMSDAPGVTPTALSKLEIADRGSRSPRKNGDTVPTVTFSQQPSSPRKEQRSPVIGPSDPDPFLNVDLDSLRARSRRGSLAPPPPDGSEQSASSSSPSKRQTRSSTTSPTKAKPKHVSTPPDSHTTPKRLRTTLQRRPSQFSKGLLPDPILLRIFQNLDIYQLIRLRIVSLHWRHLLCTSPLLLQTLDLTPYNRHITDAVLLGTILPFLGTRKPSVVDISNCFHLTDPSFSALAAACAPTTKVWRMKSVWDVSAPAVLEMANRARGLEEVDLSNCRKVSDNLLARVVGWVVQDPLTGSAHARSSSNSSSNSGGSSNAQQQYNTRSHSAKTSSSSSSSNLSPTTSSAPVNPHLPVPGTVIGCPALKTLTLSYCKHVTDRSMAHLAVHACARLESVDLTRCTTITDQGFQHWGMYNFARLRRLVLADCTYLTDNAVVYLCNAAKGLRVLDLSFCCALSDTSTEVLSLGLPHLTSLNLAFCGSAVSDSSLRSIGLHLLDLSFLSVRGCVRVTGVGVDAVLDGCRALKWFDVSQCKNLTPWVEAGGVERWGRLAERGERRDGLDWEGEVEGDGWGRRRSLGVARLEVVFEVVAGGG